LNKNKCRIHDFKPFICKHGPFLPSIINSEIESRNWLEKCPGLYQPHIKTEQKNNRIKYLTKIKMLQKKKEKDYFNLLFSDEENIYSEFIKTNNISKLINIKM
jgi:Fe-S-cluster containining protein